jgi:ribose transport system substrate-binding protein
MSAIALGSKTAPFTTLTFLCATACGSLGLCSGRNSSTTARERSDRTTSRRCCSTATRTPFRKAKRAFRFVHDSARAEVKKPLTRGNSRPGQVAVANSSLLLVTPTRLCNFVGYPHSELMQRLFLLIIACSLAVLFQLPAIQAESNPGKLVLGIVSISANEANNQRFIQAATKEAATKGWDVSVIDAAGSADQANAAIQNLVQRKVGAIIDMVFPVSSLGAGLAATKQAQIPVATWGGGLGNGVVATNGSGGPMAIPIVQMMLQDLGNKGAILALTYHTGQVAREREQVLDKGLKQTPDVKVTKNEVRIPGYFEDGAQYATAWLAAHPANSAPLAIWGSWDDPALGAISALRQQNRADVKVYGENGNAQAIESIRKGFMAATAWQDSATEGVKLVDTLDEAIKAGKSWEPKAVEVPAVVITKANVEEFVKEHPESVKK